MAVLAVALTLATATGTAFARDWSLNGVRERVQQHIGDTSAPTQERVARIGEPLSSAATPVIGQAATAVSDTQIGRSSTDLQNSAASSVNRYTGER
ncbi:hypothetical protein [Chitinasiproducens palmae]|uniref:hypothetical protein n=1 Tax=Chitinasiproducens palmae TaxID=1770053 RepID=UPI000B84D2BC|nr:hypothetical protein [Chitinasiproducens palmae]